MKPTRIDHDVYQSFVLEQLDRHYSGGILLLLKSQWPLIAKRWLTDLSAITTLLQPLYGDQGGPPRDPDSMLRSYLLNVLVRPELPPTKWVDELRTVPLYAVLSGFEPRDTPGVGTHYDFFHRLWAAPTDNLKPRLKKKTKSTKKKKGKKKGEKAPTATPGRVQRLVNWMMRHFDKPTSLPSDRLFDFIQSQFLGVSAKLGLLGDPASMSVAGDGTPVHTTAYLRSKSVCDCRAQGLATCSHPRLYTQPDCDTGWDSSRERHFNGYHLYMLTAAGSPHDLPLYPRLHPAFRHDAVSFVLSTIEFKQCFSLGTVDKMLFDAAHDAEAIYLLLDHQQIEPFIDLSARSKKNTSTDSDISISPLGVPVCPIGKEMKPNGYDHTQNRQKWRCPLACGSKNTCTTPCSKAKYGRTYHTFHKDNLRMFPKTSRQSEQWKSIYKRRTTVERSNKREKVDYKLEAVRHRSTKMWTIRLYAIMMCQHMDAWYIHCEPELKELKQRLFPAVA